MSLGLQSFGSSALSRWLSGWVWRVEHAFERARASGKAEDDTRIRIFFVLALFSAGFLTLAVGATHNALFSGAGKGDAYLAPSFMCSRCERTLSRNPSLLVTVVPPRSTRMKSPRGVRLTSWIRCVLTRQERLMRSIG